MLKHSFVIPAYKEAIYLEECIRSLTCQTVPSRILVATATPSEFIKNIAEKYNLPYYVNPESPSISGDWNFAMSKADTDYITLAHQDDIYAESYTETVLQEMAALPNALLTFTDYTEMVDGKRIPRSLNLIIKNIMLAPFWVSKSISNRFFKKAVLSFGDPVCCPSVTLHRAAVPDFKFSDKYSYILDWDAWWQLAKKEGSFIYIRKRLLAHRLHKGSETTHLITSGKRGQEERAMLQRIWGKWLGALLARLYRLGHKANLK